MVQSKKILQVLPKVLKETNYKDFGKRFQGKVRDIYLPAGRQVFKNTRITITTDRQSAFDVNLGFIPFKGAVLNMLAAFWFDKTKKIVANHLIAMPDPNVSVVKNLRPTGIEMIVRGYITGSTNTSIWGSYEKGERVIYGIKFPNGLKKNQKLKKPVITPTTHPLEKDKHDERLTREEILKRKIVPPAVYNKMEKAALELFAFGSALASRRGLILVDTKYEFGLDEKGQPVLMDEVHTPDSSRFWIKKTYKQRFSKGLEPENFDKEFLRLWYAKRINPYKDKIPPMPKDLIIDVAKRYIAVYEILTGKKFQPFDYPIEKRIEKNIENYLNSK